MYNYGYDTAYEVGATAGTAFAIAGGILIFIWLIGMAIAVFSIICNWKVYTKAGKPGWAAIVPIYNFIVLLEIVDLPLWYIVLLLVPFANIYAIFKIYIELAHKFGKETGFGIGLVFLNPIFMAILAFSKNCNFGGNVQVNQQPQEPVQPQVNPIPQEPVQPQVNPIPQEPVQPVNTNPEPTINNQLSFCTACGSKIAPGAKFCTNCGKPVE